MNRHIKSFGPRVSRRQFMIGAAGLSFAIALDGTNVATVLAKQRTGEAVSPWISIGTDGTITIMSPAVEMGQGTMTSLPLIIAEELDAECTPRHKTRCRATSSRCASLARRCAEFCSTMPPIGSGSRLRN